MTFPTPAQRADWYSTNYECPLPADPDERAVYLRELESMATHGPAAGEENP